MSRRRPSVRTMKPSSDFNINKLNKELVKSKNKSKKIKNNNVTVTSKVQNIETINDLDSNNYLKEPFKTYNLDKEFNRDIVNNIIEVLRWYFKEKFIIIDKLKDPDLNDKDKLAFVEKTKNHIDKLIKDESYNLLKQYKSELRQLNKNYGKFTELIVYRILLKINANPYYEKTLTSAGKDITPDFYIPEQKRVIEVKLNKAATTFKNKSLYLNIDKNMFSVYLSDFNSDNNVLNTNWTKGGTINLHQFINIVEHKFKVNLNDEKNLTDELKNLVNESRQFGLTQLINVTGDRIAILVDTLEQELKRMSIELQYLMKELEFKLNKEQNMLLNYESDSTTTYSLSFKDLSLRANKLKCILNKFDDKGLKGNTLLEYLISHTGKEKLQIKEYFDINKVTLNQILELEDILERV